MQTSSDYLDSGDFNKHLKLGWSNSISYSVDNKALEGYRITLFGIKWSWIHNTLILVISHLD